MDEEKEAAETEAEETREEVNEERARVDEETHDDTGRVLDAVRELSEALDNKFEALREMIGGFAEFGATVREDTPADWGGSENLADSLGEDIAEEINEDVVRDLENITFSDED